MRHIDSPSISAWNAPYVLNEGQGTMKSTSKLLIFVLTLLALTASAYAQSPRATNRVIA